MKLWVGVVIVILLLALFWTAYHYWSTGELPDSFVQRQYSKMVQYIKPRRALELYNETTGHTFDETAKAALANGLRDEQLYVEPIARGTISDAGIRDAVANSYALGNLYTHFLPQTPENVLRAAQYREETIRRIALRPAAALGADVQPERIIADWAGPELQTALLADIHAARAAAPTNYFERPIAPDSQNVHDSLVQSDSLKAFRAIQASNAAEFPTDQTARIRSLAELREYIEGLPAARRTRAGRTFDTMQLGAENTALGTDEFTILSDAWQRTASAANATQRADLRAAFADALVDSADPTGGTVCVTGRCNRLLSAFTLIDADPRIAAPQKTQDILRSEILGKAHQILRSELDAAQLGKLYDDGGEGPELDIVLNRARGHIVALRDDYPNQRPDIVDGCIRDALSGL